MNTPATYEIRVEGSLAPNWSDWFAGLSVCAEPEGTTLIAGKLEDQAALHGVLTIVRDLGLVLVSLRRIDA